MDYLSIYLIGTLFVQISLGMNSFINTQGFAKTAMLTVSIGAIINIILDPIFIFGFDMGVQGAALATIIAQFASAAWVLFFLFGKQSRLKIRREYMRPTKKIVLPILALGVAPFVMQSTESLVIVSLNTQLQQFGGDLAVGSMTIMSSIMQLILLPLIGLSQGAQPIISYNYGAGAMERVRRTYQVLLLACLSYSILFTGMLMSEPEFFVTLFNNDAELVALTVKSMPLFFGGMFLFGAQIACQQTFLAVGEAKISLFLALLRKILLLVPLVYVLPLFFENKLRAVLLAESIADMSAVIITLVTFMIFYRKKLTKKRIQQAA